MQADFKKNDTNNSKRKSLNNSWLLFKLFRLLLLVSFFLKSACIVNNFNDVFFGFFGFFLACFREKLGYHCWLHSGYFYFSVVLEDVYFAGHAEGCQPVFVEKLVCVFAGAYFNYLYRFFF